MESSAAHSNAALSWHESGHSRSAAWRSASDAPPPREIAIARTGHRVDRALRDASQGVGMLWRGGFADARRLLADMTTRLDRRTVEPVRDPSGFYRYRQARKNRARVLGMLVVELGPDGAVDLPGAPDVRAACREAFGATGPCVMSLRELMGATSAYRWRREGVPVPALNSRIHPHYGVFPPTRNEYVDLVASAGTARVRTAFDIGTGTGVLAAVLARRGAGHVVATDIAPQAVVCARETMRRLGLDDQVTVERTDLFPRGRADLVVCNPPWLPATPASSLDAAVFDGEGRMLARFLDEVSGHLESRGEAWLVLSTLPELIGLRTGAQLRADFDAAGLAVLERLDTGPRHRRARIARDPLAAARAAERVSLWRLGTRGETSI